MKRFSKLHQIVSRAPSFISSVSSVSSVLFQKTNAAMSSPPVWVKLDHEWVVTYRDGVLHLLNSRHELCPYQRAVPLEYQHETPEQAAAGPVLPRLSSNKCWTLAEGGFGGPRSWFAVGMRVGTFVYGQAPDYKTRHFGHHQLFADPRPLTVLQQQAEVKGCLDLEGGDDNSATRRGDELFATEAEAEVEATRRNLAHSLLHDKLHDKLCCF